MTIRNWSLFLLIIGVLPGINLSEGLAQDGGLDFEILLAEPGMSDLQVQRAYPARKESIQAKKQVFADEFSSCKNDEERAVVKERAKAFLSESLLSEIVPLWEGTAWTFDGYTRKPREGNIACGWFVQRVLEDLGFTLEKKRTKHPYFAQNWPKTMINGLDPDWAREIPAGENSGVLRDSIMSFPNGLYLTGFALYEGDLGQHVGFLLKTAQDIYVIHSLGSVKKTSAENNSYYSGSTSIYLARLFHDSVIEAWILDRELEW